MGKFDGLIVDIGLEKENLKDLVDELGEVVKSIGVEPSVTEIRAAGSILHDFYTGLEKVFERIALVIDGGMPEGSDWHVQLLRRMAKPIDKKRPAVFQEQLVEELNLYLSFRHVFRNIYGFELKWERMKNLVDGLPSLFKNLDGQLQEFLAFLSKM